MQQARPLLETEIKIVSRLEIGDWRLEIGELLKRLMPFARLRNDAELFPVSTTRIWVQETKLLDGQNGANRVKGGKGDGQDN
ncbi:MAG TPA: hypothetical protein DD001_20680 [Microcoleaceae bacterium UBA10368]|nr:hypothetical protein [Microcoleaceae cyanobacterium UBA10368]HCV30868.1 hypothetical protein [Microcoleaceae cyanobacterium UBA9251]